MIIVDILIIQVLMGKLEGKNSFIIYFLILYKNKNKNII